MIAQPKSGSFTKVSAIVTVPKVNCSVTPGWTSPYGADSFHWVGFGESNKTMEQAGVVASCESPEQPNYSAQFEMYPATPTTSVVAVHPGNRVFESVRYSGGEYWLTIRNMSTGRWQNMIVKSSDKRGNAEVITSHWSWLQNFGAVQLADFGQVGFRSISFTDSHGTTGSLTSPAWTYKRVIMLGTVTNDMISVPGVVFSHGTAFDVTWKGEH
jgi:hypothetical protein